MFGLRTRTARGTAIPSLEAEDDLPTLRACRARVGKDPRIGDQRIAVKPWSASDSGAGLSLEMHRSGIDSETAIRPYVYAAGPRELVARSRGSALAWPLIDAVIERDGTLCALHSEDSFIQRDSTVKTTRRLRYRWNGFGFSAATAADCDAWSP